MARLILAEQGRTFVIAVTDTFSADRYVWAIFCSASWRFGRSVMVSIPTIIVIMLAAAVVVAGLLWAEWWHR